MSRPNIYRSKPPEIEIDDAEEERNHRKGYTQRHGITRDESNVIDVTISRDDTAGTLAKEHELLSKLVGQDYDRVQDEQHQSQNLPSDIEENLYGGNAVNRNPWMQLGARKAHDDEVDKILREFGIDPDSLGKDEKAREPLSTYKQDSMNKPAEEVLEASLPVHPDHAKAPTFVPASRSVNGVVLPPHVRAMSGTHLQTASHVVGSDLHVSGPITTAMSNSSHTLEHTKSVPAQPQDDLRTTRSNSVTGTMTQLRSRSGQQSAESRIISPDVPPPIAFPYDQPTARSTGSVDVASWDVASSGQWLRTDRNNAVLHGSHNLGMMRPDVALLDSDKQSIHASVIEAQETLSARDSILKRTRALHIDESEVKQRELYIDFSKSLKQITEAQLLYHFGASPSESDLDVAIESVQHFLTTRLQPHAMGQLVRPIATRTTQHLHIPAQDDLDETITSPVSSDLASCRATTPECGDASLGSASTQRMRSLQENLAMVQTSKNLDSFDQAAQLNTTLIKPLSSHPRHVGVPVRTTSAASPATAIEPLSDAPAHVIVDMGMLAPAASSSEPVSPADFITTDSEQRHFLLNDESPDTAKIYHTTPLHADLSGASPCENTVSTPAQDLIMRETQLVEEVRSLKDENRHLRQQLADIIAAKQGKEEHGVRWPVLYRLECKTETTTYFDRPSWILGSDHIHLDARQRVPSESIWESQQQSAPFVVYQSFKCDSHPANSSGLLHSETSKEMHGQTAQQYLSCSLDTIHEEVALLDDEFCNELLTIFGSHPQLHHYHPFYAPRPEGTRVTFVAPFLVHYHWKSSLQEAVHSFTAASQKKYLLLLEYLEMSTAKHEAEVNTLLSNNTITGQYLPYLFRPHELLVQKIEAGILAVLQQSVLTELKPREWHCRCARLEFNGGYKERPFDMMFIWPGEDQRRAISIYDLPIRSVNLEPNLKARLIARGKFFASCETPRYVRGPDPDGGEGATTRYMVDVETYRIMHKREEAKGTLVLEHDDEFYIRLPPKIRAFNMHKKVWREVSVDQLEGMEWNTEAFESLAIDDGTKDVIHAVVTNKISAEEGTDLVVGKGSGLVLLLHGGPGTGKTLTAEGVAEIARKPLYRVTCGDIGTDPKEVEEYLESVFTLGRRWGCVVLLDEADVFLEQRGISSLERNALVSVFLRVLEYYDGILLITSNRVGTFDEAFKSRIQLAIHYKTLTGEQRLKIWGNFLNRLLTLNVDLDIGEIRDHLKELASHKLNGRQIRNIITTARQIAQFRNETLRYKHVKTAVDFTTSFESYLKDVHEELTDEERQREFGIR